MRLAAIDLGTNSFHLVIADTKPTGAFRIVSSEKESVRLGETGADMKYLAPEAIQRGLTALRRFKALLDARGVRSVKAIATSAIREAENQDEFIRRARIEVGISIDVVSGVEEGRLIYLGMLQALPLYSKKVLLVDIGGGSTEYVIGERAIPRYISSLKLGAIRITRRFNLADDPTDRAVEDARKYIVGELYPAAKAIHKQGFEVMAASSGTAQSIAAMIAYSRANRNGPPIVPDRLNNFHCTYDEVRSAVRKLLVVRSLQERKKIPGIDEKRADIILGGALILQESMRLSGAKEMIVSSYALREGIIYDFIHTKKAHKERRHDKLRDVRITSVRHLAEQCGYDERHADHIADLCDSIFMQLKSLHGLGEQEREYLRYAAILHDVGYHISHAEHHKHSYYMISNADLLGFTHEEIEIIANIARYHRKSHPKLKHEGFLRLQTDEHRTIVRKLAAILRIAEGLDRGNIGVIRSVKCSLSSRKVTFHLTKKRGAGRDAELEIWGADRKKMLFQEVYTREVRFIEA